MQVLYALLLSSALAGLALWKRALTPGGTLLGAGIIALIFALGTGNPKALLPVAMAGFLGAAFDSVLGSRAQAKFLCTVCRTVTERETHCGKNTRLISGLRRLNNDAVNFLSNLFSLALALLLAI